MKALCLDSAYKCLAIGLYEDDCMICGTANLSWERQSETISSELIRLMREVSWDNGDIDEVVITDGLRSYAGVRTAICVAKVLCVRKHIPLYAVSTLQLYAGIHEHASVMLDARGQRAYTGALRGGRFVEEEQILTLDEAHLLLSQADYQLFGDCELTGLEAEESKFLEDFIALRPFYRKIKNVYTLTPCYLKEPNAYKVKS